MNYKKKDYKKGHKKIWKGENLSRARHLFSKARRVYKLKTIRR